MPREYNWAAEVQRQLPGNIVMNLGYSGNRGLGLLATNTISSFPKDLLIPSLAASSQTFMASPNAGQTDETTVTGARQGIPVAKRKEEVPRDLDASVKWLVVNPAQDYLGMIGDDGDGFVYPLREGGEQEERRCERQHAGRRHRAAVASLRRKPLVRQPA